MHKLNLVQGTLLQNEPILSSLTWKEPFSIFYHSMDISQLSTMQWDCLYFPQNKHFSSLPLLFFFWWERFSTFHKKNITLLALLLKVCKQIVKPKENIYKANVSFQHVSMHILKYTHTYTYLYIYKLCSNSYSLIALWAQNYDVLNMSQIGLCLNELGNLGRGCNLWERESCPVGAYMPSLLFC